MWMTFHMISGRSLQKTQTMKRDGPRGLGEYIKYHIICSLHSPQFASAIAPIMVENDHEYNPIYGPEERLAEYNAIVDYTTSIVKSRFTVAGLYVAAIGFVAAAVFNNTYITWWPRFAASALAIWFTICLWILELRNRSLLGYLALRGVDIEQRYWNLTGKERYNGFFSRQNKHLVKDE